MDLEERAIMQKSRRELKKKKKNSQVSILRENSSVIVSLNQEQFAIYKKGSKPEEL